MHTRQMRTVGNPASLLAVPLHRSIQKPCHELGRVPTGNHESFADISRRSVLAYFGKYDSPSEVVDDQALTQTEKVELLQSWRNDKEAYMRASDEGMPGPDRADILRKIENALLALQATGVEK